MYVSLENDKVLCKCKVLCTMNMESHVVWWIGIILSTKEQLVGLGSRPSERKEIASVNHSHFLEGRIEKWHSSYSP